MWVWPGREPFGDTLSMGSEESVVGGFKDRECDLGKRLPQIADDALARHGAHDVWRR